jgi:dsRNA-specific ribonuclease
VRVKLFEVVVVYNFGDIMCKGYGNTKKQAERNASINGLNWMRKEGILGE